MEEVLHYDDALEEGEEYLSALRALRVRFHGARASIGNSMSNESLAEETRIYEPATISKLVRGKRWRCGTKNTRRLILWYRARQKELAKAERAATRAVASREV